jgi:hypothetical protein
MIGPVPITQQRKEELEREQRKAGVDSRAKKMKDQLSGKVQQEPEGPRREDWMTELPPQVKAFGLGPRKFRTRDVDLGDRSVCVPITQRRKEELEREQRKAGVDSRAKKMKDQLSGKVQQEPEGPRREDWMTELPPQVKAFGLGPRKFRTRDVDLGDRSVWTDTPADRCTYNTAEEGGA